MGVLGFLGGIANAVGQMRQQTMQNQRLAEDDALRRAILLSHLQKPMAQKMGTPVRVEMNGQQGLRYPDGHTEWLGQGESFYEKPIKPAAPSTKSILTAEQAAVAESTGLGPDVSKWTPQDAERFKRAMTAWELSKQRPPAPYPPSLWITTDEAGKPIAADISRPRGGGPPSVSRPVSLPGLPKGKGPTKSPVAKPPAGFPTGYTRSPSSDIPGAILLTPNPGTKDPDSGVFGIGAKPATPLLYWRGKYFRPGDEVTHGARWKP